MLTRENGDLLVDKVEKKEDQDILNGWMIIFTKLLLGQKDNINKLMYKAENGLKVAWKKFSVDSIIEAMYQPRDAASLGVVRALFGLCMVLDVVEERGFAEIDIKWGDPYKCHFPLINGMEPLPFPWMIILYTIMWMGAFGIMLGFHFKMACACFIFPYWYIFLLDKSYWNNHTYLYGIVAVLLWGTEANRYFAFDVDDKINRGQSTVPFWNYFALKFQFFLLYFLAGLKKGSREWLDGYAMTNLSSHWVFNPFKILLTDKQTDLYVVHWFGFFFDLTIAFWMLYEKTRFPAMIFCAAFHFMNSRLFSIGMFPYVCLATMFLFCNDDWPRRMQFWFQSNILNLFSTKKILKKTSESKNIKCQENGHNNNSLKEEDEEEDIEDSTPKGIRDENNPKSRQTNEKMSTYHRKRKRRQRFVVFAILIHAIVQIFLPYSHFVTKGYNNWVPGLYGYSWNMMVHAWDTILVVVKVQDNEKGESHFIDPEAWIQNDRWYKHGDMLKQYAHCLKGNLLKEKRKIITNKKLNNNEKKLMNLSSNISVFIDVWCSLNGRFQQRMFQPNVDLLKVDWNVFQPVSYLMPLLSDLSDYRNELDEIRQKVYSWSNYTDVIFVADFPKMFLENYVNKGLSNVTLTVLEGSVTYNEDGWRKNKSLTKGFSTKVSTEVFHRILVTSSYPACYMYTYTNSTKAQFAVEGKLNELTENETSILKEFEYRINAWLTTFGHIANAFFYFVHNVPIIRRTRMIK